MEPLRPATRVVHDGRPAKVPDAPLNTPITMASTYVGGGDWEYGRFTNPTWSAFEETLGALEGGRALAFSSGQAATSVLLDLVADSTVVCGQAYNGTISQLVDLQARERLRATLVDITDLAAVRSAIDDDTALVWIESPTNPGMAVADLPALIEMAHEAGARVVVDNTFATPLLQQPLALGADIVLHSVTKFLAGHSDVTMGAIVVNDDDLFKVIKGRRDLLGAVPGPFETWLALRGMRTLALRVERASANARELATRLRAEGIDVRDPGFGAMLAIVLPTAEAGEWVERRVRLWTHATSLGGVESTLERRRRWVSESPDVPEGLVRLSVGIEDVEDLWADLDQAIKAALA